MERYSRQMLYNKIGVEGQRLIASRTVLIVGTGALGSLSGELLARAGIGKLILIDRDYVEYSNLQRQTLYTEKDADEKKPKVIAAKERLLEIRPDLEIDAHIAHCDGPLLEDLAEEADLLLDGTDNFDTRLLINDVAYKYGKPWVYAACVEASYSSCGFVPGATPCYRCLVPVLPTTTLTCDTAGIIAPAVPDGGGRTGHHSAEDIDGTVRSAILHAYRECMGYGSYEIPHRRYEGGILRNMRGSPDLPGL